MRYTEQEARLLELSQQIVNSMSLVETEDGAQLRWPSEYENLRRPTFDLLRNEKRDLGDIGLTFFTYGFWPNIYARLLTGSRDPAPFQAVSELMEDNNAVRNLSRFVLGELGLDGTNELVLQPEMAPPPLAQNLTQDMRSINSLHGNTPGPNLPGMAMTLIIHGTWPGDGTWWQQNGGFWRYINTRVSGLYGGADAYFWSGSIKDTARITAARELIQWVRAHPAEHLDIIAHSHGGNVALIASGLGLKIRKLILLGTPIRTEYIPQLDNIGRIYNVFSTGDWVQKPGGVPNTRGEGRTLADTDKIMNRRATDNGSGSNPGHSELHNSATWNASHLDTLL